MLRVPSGGSHHRLVLSIAAVLLFTGSSCGTSSDGDGGTDSATPDAGRDATVVLCASDGECDNDLFCDGVERCLPGTAAAQDDGCVRGTAPCADDCNESSDQCECGMIADADGDGHDSVACGGGDCDDGDDQRFPGNGEVCDLAGHDEDCLETTVGETDADGDGFIDAMCCNSAYGVCGDDCDDTRSDVYPGVTEQCNAVDDDCDGVVDGPGSYCAAGMCVDRRCRAVSWEWVFGSDQRDLSYGLEVDSLGNVYARFDLRGSGGDINGDGDPDLGGRYLVSIAPNGGIRWTRMVTYGAYGIAISGDEASIAIPADGAVVLRSTSDGSLVSSIAMTPGGRWEAAEVVGVSRLGDEIIVSVLLSLGGDVEESAIELRRYGSAGAELGRRTIEVAGDLVELTDVSGGRNHLALIGTTRLGIDLGGVSLPGGQFLAVLNRDLSTNWVVPTSAFHRVAVSDDGAAAGVGLFSGTWVAPGSSTVYRTAPGGEAGFVVSFAPGGAHRWTNVHDGPGRDFFVGVSFDGRDNIFVSGLFSGDMDVRPRGRLGPSIGGGDAFFGLWDAEDGVPLFARQIVGSVSEAIYDVRVDAFGAMLVLGGFGENVTLPSGTEYSTTGTGSDLFLLRISDL